MNNKESRVRFPLNLTPFPLFLIPSSYDTLVIRPLFFFRMQKKDPSQLNDPCSLVLCCVTSRKGRIKLEQFFRKNSISLSSLQSVLCCIRNAFCLPKSRQHYAHHYTTIETHSANNNELLLKSEMLIRH